MAKRDEDRGLATSAGLIRYMDVDISKIKVSPETVVGITISVIILEVILNYGIFI
ncbi:MAG TPA: preprotein translocase subunit Sec61beta [Methanothermococcus okinawensis]|uniref:Preprotein translocase subunit SecG n=1 Tax=Methanothermococcus okinawensis TaxID=155863 RepID=A0A832ZC66_9EURY|nr:preprotein translocase subunit Sec61beta [Methanococcaceae archaeon]HIP84731.1 preprotein translocase subunit Sec61beta [Methanothermococcus okinawensis]HIP90857.1 preprotein translocase subunit Sec61beta [Methanothermococcus okinawensis]